MGKVMYRGPLVRIEQYTCLVVPGAIAAPLGDGYRVPVVGTINGFPLRTSVFRTRENDRMMIVNKGMQRGTQIGLGEDVTVELHRDDDRCPLALPPDVARALTRTRRAKTIFEQIPSSHQKRYLDWIGEAKRPETRARRIEQTVERLLLHGSDQRAR
jgi:bacteriocin resistance YdeI/OmpD-like protein/uncharacterized protein DUF1905